MGEDDANKRERCVGCSNRYTRFCIGMGMGMGMGDVIVVIVGGLKSRTRVGKGAGLEGDF